MPEGDTVFRVARRLNQAFAGDVLTRADLRWPGLSTASLIGMRTLEVAPRGKHILHRLGSGWTIHSHLRMDGMWRLVAADKAGPLRDPAIRAVVGSASWVAIGRRLGVLDLVRTSDEAILVGHLGPDLLGPGWDADQADLAVVNLAASPLGIAEALLDQRNLAGAGTVWTSEALFVARLNPWAPAATLNRERLRAVVGWLHRLLALNVEHAVQSSTGDRRPGRETYVYGRHNRPCRRCGTPIGADPLSTAAEARVIFHCPSCQTPSRLSTSR